MGCVKSASKRGNPTQWQIAKPKTALIVEESTAIYYVTKKVDNRKCLVSVKKEEKEMMGQEAIKITRTQKGKTKVRRCTNKKNKRQMKPMKTPKKTR